MRKDHGYPFNALHGGLASGVMVDQSEGTKQTHIKLLSVRESLAREVLKDVLWEAPEYGRAMDLARDWED